MNGNNINTDGWNRHQLYVMESFEEIKIDVKDLKKEQTEMKVRQAITETKTKTQSGGIAVLTSAITNGLIHGIKFFSGGG